ncbi:MAG: class II fructose-bisphosphate aldolase [Alphaproteobacteria bacterium]|nr:class II fructose-bisphosphate aldolase [Alphaproteobacteria bacterium]
MTRATLTDVLGPTHAVAGFVCLGWEDARAYVAAAEAERAPVILQAGPGARAHMPLPIWGAMLGALADAATVPVVVHLDHGESHEVCAAAIATGFTSVMFDGSALPLADNIAQTARIAAMAQAAGVSCEGEIGFVGYAAGAAGRGTDPDEAAAFADRTGVDAMAVSVGNVHLMQGAGAPLDEGLIAAIRSRTGVPLVIHGGSGVPADQRSALARSGAVTKFNIGTELRQVWGVALRDTLAADAALFDRIAILRATEGPLAQAAAQVIAGMR